MDRGRESERGDLSVNLEWDEVGEVVKRERERVCAVIVCAIVIACVLAREINASLHGLRSQSQCTYAKKYVNL